MEITTVAKYIRISPRKARAVAGVIRVLKPSAALTTLKFVPRKAALPIYKVLKTAISDSKHNFGIEEDKLTFKKIVIEEGPRLRRYRPVAHGRVHPYKKRMSHIKIVLEGEPTKVAEAAKETKTDKALSEDQKTNIKNQNGK